MWCGCRFSIARVKGTEKRFLHDARRLVKATAGLCRHLFKVATAVVELLGERRPIFCGKYIGIKNVILPCYGILRFDKETINMNLPLLLQTNAAILRIFLPCYSIFYHMLRQNFHFFLQPAYAVAFTTTY